MSPLSLKSSSLMSDHFTIQQQNPKASKFVSKESLTAHKMAIGATAAVVTAAVAYLATQSFSSASKASEGFCPNNLLKNSPLLSICLPHDRPEPATCDPLSFLFLDGAQPKQPTVVERASEFFSNWTQYLFSSPIESKPVPVATSTVPSYLNNTAVNNTVLPTCLPQAHNAEQQPLTPVEKAIKDFRDGINIKEVDGEQPKKSIVVEGVSEFFSNWTQYLFSSPMNSKPVQLATSTAPSYLNNTAANNTVLPMDYLFTLNTNKRAQIVTPTPVFYLSSSAENNTILPTYLPQAHNAEQQPLTPVEKAIKAFRDSLQMQKEYWEKQLNDCKSGVKRGWLSSFDPCERIPHRLNCLNDKAGRAIQEQSIRDYYSQTWEDYWKEVLEANLQTLPSLPNLMGMLTSFGF